MKPEIYPIAGDASFRKFYRIKLKKSNKIIVSAKKEKYKNLIAYTAINSFLRKNKILTPKLYSYNYLVLDVVLYLDYIYIYVQIK